MLLGVCRGPDRCTEKVAKHLYGPARRAQQALRRVGILHRWKGADCLRCQGGKYGRLLGGKHYCNRRTCTSKVSLWKGTVFLGSRMDARACYNACLGYCAGLTPTMMAVDKGINRGTASRYCRYFRAAEAFCGAEARATCVFRGSESNPCHVEIDEAVVRKTKLYANGVRVGTIHWAVFAMRKRGSLDGVAYCLQPRSVPVSTDGKPASLPPPDASELLPYLDLHIGDYVILHTDGARAYSKLIPELLRSRALVLHDAVNHGAHEWVRFQKYPASTTDATAVSVKCIAGTQLVEGFWHVIKHHVLPPEAAANLANIEAYVLAYLWRSQCLGDPLADLGRAVSRWMQAFEFEPMTRDPSFVAQDAEAEADPNSDIVDDMDDDALGAALAACLGDAVPLAPGDAAPLTPGDAAPLTPGDAAPLDL